MAKRKYSDRIYCTILWEFMQFCKKQLWDTSLINNSFKINSQIIETSNKELKELFENEKVLEAMQLIAPSVFLDFIIKNEEILDEKKLLEWVKQKQNNYPIKEKNRKSS